MSRAAPKPCVVGCGADALDGAPGPAGNLCAFCHNLGIRGANPDGTLIVDRGAFCGHVKAAGYPSGWPGEHAGRIAKGRT